MTISPLGLGQGWLN